jgi:hypothetical protein
MRKIIFISALALFLSGCAPTLHKAIAPNRENLKKINIGMSKDEVLQIMGTKPFVSGGFVQLVRRGDKRQKTIVINNPYRSETLSVKDKGLQVVYYVTDIKYDDSVITDDELTPFIFEEGKLIGWGQSFLQNFKAKSGRDR